MNDYKEIIKNFKKRGLAVLTKFKGLTIVRSYYSEDSDCFLYHFRAEKEALKEVVLISEKFNFLTTLYLEEDDFIYTIKVPGDTIKIWVDYEEEKRNV